jgi:hypothetical protein
MSDSTLLSPTSSPVENSHRSDAEYVVLRDDPKPPNDFSLSEKPKHESKRVVVDVNNIDEVDDFIKEHAGERWFKRDVCTYLPARRLDGLLTKIVDQPNAILYVLVLVIIGFLAGNYFNLPFRSAGFSSISQHSCPSNAKSGIKVEADRTYTLTYKGNDQAACTWTNACSKTQRDQCYSWTVKCDDGNRIVVDQQTLKSVADIQWAT